LNQLIPKRRKALSSNEGAPGRRVDHKAPTKISKETQYIWWQGYFNFLRQERKKHTDCSLFHRAHF
jgi:hypothetical protein